MTTAERVLRELTDDPCYTIRCWEENGGSTVKFRLEYNSGRGIPVGPISMDVPKAPSSFELYWTEYILTRKDIHYMNSRDVLEETLTIIIGQMIYVVDEERGVQPTPSGE
jgi:hypothetical protein